MYILCCMYVAMYTTYSMTLDSATFKANSRLKVIWIKDGVRTPYLTIYQKICSWVAQIARLQQWNFIVASRATVFGQLIVDPYSFFVVNDNNENCIGKCTTSYPLWWFYLWWRHGVQAPMKFSLLSLPQNVGTVNNHFPKCRDLPQWKFIVEVATFGKPVTKVCG